MYIKLRYSMEVPIQNRKLAEKLCRSLRQSTGLHIFLYSTRIIIWGKLNFIGISSYERACQLAEKYMHEISSLLRNVLDAEVPIRI